MNSPRTVITCPVPADPTERFMRALPETDLIIADDSNGKLTAFANRANTTLLDYEAQERLLGKRLYRQFERYHKSAACRNIAHYLAYKEGYDYVVALDYDCVVPSGYIEAHARALGKHHVPVRKSSVGWVNPLENGEWYSRGFPYAKRDSNAKITEKETSERVVLNMGLWENVVDINGIDKMIASAPEKCILSNPTTAVDGFIPLCGMNNMFHRDVIPAYFFLPNIRIGSWTLSRHDDIWGGYLFQLLAGKRGDVISYGEPIVFHERESNRAYVVHYEHFMHLLEPYFYPIADAAAKRVSRGSYVDMFADLAEEFSQEVHNARRAMPAHYMMVLQEVADSLILWRTLFQKLS